MPEIELDTPDQLKYNFFPAKNRQLNFKIRAKNDAHICLTQTESDENPKYEVFIGGWGNTRSVIRKDGAQPECAISDTQGILSEDAFTGFWIKWADNVIRVGKEGEPEPFMSHEVPDLFDVKFVGVCTGWGASGSWRIDESEEEEAEEGGEEDVEEPEEKDVDGDEEKLLFLSNTQKVNPTPKAYGWVPPIDREIIKAERAYTAQLGFVDPPQPSFHWEKRSNGEIPEGAVCGGIDEETGDKLFVARAEHNGAIIPGKFVFAHGVTYVAWGGEEHGKNEYEILCGGEGTWHPAADGEVPEGAMEGGTSEDGETLYIGRVKDGNTLMIGKVQRSHQVCYVPYGGKELPFPNYEVLMN